MARTKAMSRGIRKSRRSFRKYSKRRMTGRQKARLYKYKLCNPEKGFFDITWNSVIYHSTNNTNLIVQTNLWPLTKGFWPLQGVADNQRLGDRIKMLKMYIRASIETDDTPNAILARIVIFTSDKLDISTSAGAVLSNFWRRQTPNTAIAGQVNHEGFNIIRDKTIKIGKDTENGRSLSGLIQMNIYPKTWRKEIQFEGDTQSLKYNNQNLWLAIIAYQPNTVDLVSVGWMNVNARAYYSE